jgi:hypothetical protein
MQTRQFATSGDASRAPQSTPTSHSPRRTRSPETNADKPSTVESPEDHQRIGSKPADARSTVKASDRERPPSSAGRRLIERQSGGNLASVDEDAPRAPAALEVQAGRLPGRSRDARSWTMTKRLVLRLPNARFRCGSDSPPRGSETRGARPRHEPAGRRLGCSQTAEFVAKRSLADVRGARVNLDATASAHISRARSGSVARCPGRSSRPTG